MALPKFTTTPTPLYQQQPIIKRPNYSEIYLRNFAAAEASMANSFGRIAARLDKITLEKEKQKKEQLQKNRDEYEDNTSLDARINSIFKNLNTQNRAKAIEVFSDQADGIRKAREEARNDETGEKYKTLSVIEKAFFDNISLFATSMDNVENLRTASLDKDFDSIYSDYQEDSNWNAFRNEIISNDGYDVGFNLAENGMVEISYTDNASGEKVFIGADELATMDLENWGIKRTDWTDEDAAENIQLTGVYSLISGGGAGKALLDAHNGLRTISVSNQQATVVDGVIKPGSVTLTSQKVTKYSDPHKKIITDYTFDTLSSSLTPQQIAKIFHDNVALRGIEREADSIAKEMINLSGGKYTEENYEELRAAVLTYGPNKINNKDLKDNPIYTEVHEFINTKAITWATNRFWAQNYGKNEKIASEPNISEKIDMDAATAGEVSKLFFLQNIPDVMNQVDELKSFALKNGDATQLQTKLNWISKTYGVDAFKNSRTDAEVDADVYNEKVASYIEDGMTEEEADAKATEESIKIIGDNFTYTDKTPDWKVFKMIMKANDYNLSDKEAQDLYKSWVIDEKQHGGNAFLRKLNGLEENHWSNWLLNEKNNLKTIMDNKLGADPFDQFLNPGQD